MAKIHVRTPYRCQCDQCQLHPRGMIHKQHQRLNRLVSIFNERDRRLFVGFLASEESYDGIRGVARISGLSRNTVRRGAYELDNPEKTIDSRTRHSGGGRKPVEKKLPES
jgi:hypothetical protein